MSSDTSPPISVRPTCSLRSSPGATASCLGLKTSNQLADLLFEIVSRRHEAGKPVLISTNLAFREWGGVFPNATCTVALVDRLVHRADVLKLDAESWRRKESQERAERQNAAKWRAACLDVIADSTSTRAVRSASSFSYGSA